MGWGSPWYGYDCWDPYGFDSWCGPGYDEGYGYYDPDAYNYYEPYPDPSVPPYASPDSPEGPGAYQNEAVPQDSSYADAINDSAQGYAPVVQLYFKNGAIVPVTDYWMADNKLHYADRNGVEITVGMNQLDLQRTVDENAKRGMQFTLKPVPNGSNTAPASN